MQRKFYFQSPRVLPLLLSVASLLPVAQTVTAQAKNIQHIQQSWLGGFNQTRITNHWGAWADVHLRTKEDFTNSISQSIVRVGATYYVHDKLKLTAGYAYVHHFPADNHKNIAQPEHRPWQQVQWHNNSSRFKLMQWIRLEERYRRKILNDDALADGYLFNWRVRYNIMAQVALGKRPFQKGTVALAFNNESMLNAGKQIVYNSFDQNRFFAGVHVYTSAHNWLQLGYMNLYQQTSSGKDYRMIHTARLFFFQNLDLRQKQNAAH